MLFFSGIILIEILVQQVMRQMSRCRRTWGWTLFCWLFYARKNLISLRRSPPPLQIQQKIFYCASSPFSTTCAFHSLKAVLFSNVAAQAIPSEMMPVNALNLAPRQTVQKTSTVTHRGCCFPLFTLEFICFSMVFPFASMTAPISDAVEPEHGPVLFSIGSREVVEPEVEHNTRQAKSHDFTSPVQKSISCVTIRLHVH